MNKEKTFSPYSKVWIYQSSRPFSAEETGALNIELQNFADQWTAHNNHLLAVGKVVEDRFIILMVDETLSSTSGCSIDASIHFIKSVEKKYGINLFDRKLFNFISGGEIHTAQLDELEELVKKNVVTGNTIIFDPLVNNKADFDTRFKLPFNESWIKQFA